MIKSELTADEAEHCAQFAEMSIWERHRHGKYVHQFNDDTVCNAAMNPEVHLSDHRLGPLHQTHMGEFL